MAERSRSPPTTGIIPVRWSWWSMRRIIGGSFGSSMATTMPWQTDCAWRGKSWYSMVRRTMLENDFVELALRVGWVVQPCLLTPLRDEFHIALHKREGRLTILVGTVAGTERSLSCR